MSASRDDFSIAIRSALLQRGAGQKFSLIVFIFLSVIIFFFDSYPSKVMDQTRSILNDGIYKISAVSTSPFKLVTFLKNETISHLYVRSENKSLNKELELLRNKNFQIEYLTAENRKLQKKLSTIDEEAYESVMAKVIVDKDSPFLKSLIVNRGSKSGIKKGMPVVDENYLVGRIVEVNYLSSRILLLNDLNSRIPVAIEPLSTQAILSGMGESEPELHYLPELFVHIDGNTVFTSGKDGIFSPGIPIGKTLVEKNILKVKLFSDPNQLSYVNIILVKKSNKGLE